MSEPDLELTRRPEDTGFGAGWTEVPASRVAVALVVGTAAALLLNAYAFADWIYALPLWLDPAREAVLGVADAFAAWTERVGLDRPHAAVHEALERLRLLPGPGGPPM